MGTHSHERANSEIYRAFCTALSTKANNPALSGVTILRTELSADGSTVRAFLSFGGSMAEERKTLDAFNKSAGFFRSEIAKTVALRRVPKLSFIIDRGNNNANRVEELLSQIHGGK